MNIRLARYAPRSAMPVHHHEEAWICVVMSGTYRETIGGRSHEHRPGDVLFCPALMQHEQRFGAAGAAKILLAPGEANLQYLNKSRLKLREAPYVRSTAALRVAMRLRRELETFDPFASLAIEGLALELIAIFGRAGTPASHAPPSWLRNVRAFLEEDLSRRLSLEGIAAEAGRHPVHVAREFRRYYGCTAGEYLRQLRADKAAGLLRATQMPLTEVALCCGYSDSAQLSRSFRAAFGTTPSTYRRLTR